MHLLFDLDGTLTDSQSGIIRSVHHALVENGLAAPAADKLRWVIGPPILKSIATLVGEDSAHLFDSVVARYRDRYGRIGLFENEVYPEIETALAELTGSGPRCRAGQSHAGRRRSALAHALRRHDRRNGRHADDDRSR